MLTTEQRLRMMETPQTTFDLVIDTDAYNEIDDQFAISYALRAQDRLHLLALCAAAARALRWGGRLYLVHKPERLADLMVFLRAARLEPKRLRFVRHSAASAVSLVLLEARLGGKPGLQIEPELVLYGPDGSESAACRRIYHRQE